MSGKPGKPLLEQKYRIRGSDMSWEDVWGKDDNVTVSIYDYGPGARSSYDPRKNGTVKREIRTFLYVFDSRSGRFVEESSDGESSSNLAK